MDKHDIAYTKRTLKHIQRVQENGLYLIENHSDTLELSNIEQKAFFNNLLKHDRSKWSDLQFTAYVDKFNRKKEPNDFKLAWENHYLVENHHIERGMYFSKIQMLEVICDLQAMSQEFGEGDCSKFFEEKWLVRLSEYCRSKPHSDLAYRCSDPFHKNSLKTYMRRAIKCFKEL